MKGDDTFETTPAIQILVIILRIEIFILLLLKYNQLLFVSSMLVSQGNSPPCNS